jgi:hypothetical protein
MTDTIAFLLGLASAIPGGLIVAFVAYGRGYSDGIAYCSKAIDQTKLLADQLAQLALADAHESDADGFRRLPMNWSTALKSKRN